MANEPPERVSREHIVVPRQDQISVFPNEGGGVTIRMDQDDLYGSQPSEVMIAVPLQFVDPLIKALRKAKEEAAS